MERIGHFTQISATLTDDDDAVGTHDLTISSPKQVMTSSTATVANQATWSGNGSDPRQWFSNSTIDLDAFLDSGICHANHIMVRKEFMRNFRMFYNSL